jgi:formylglycine-generating enzyme required for sulfatase activity
MMKKMLLVLLALSLVAVGCKKVGKTYTPPKSDNVLIGEVGVDNIFWMGSPDGTNGTTVEDSRKPDETPHLVKINPFEIMNTEVTQKAFKEIGDPLGIKFNEKTVKDRGDNFPVASVPYINIIKYANALSVKDGLEEVYTYDEATKTVEWDTTKNGWRLPTEAEYEFALKGKLPSDYRQDDMEYRYGIWPWGNTPDISKANISTSAIKKSVEVGSYPKATRFGLYDIYGNVDEFVWGNYDTNYGLGAKPNQTTVYDDLTVQGGTVALNYGSAVIRKGGCYNEVYGSSRPSSHISTAMGDAASLDADRISHPEWGFRLVKNYEVI